MNFDQSWMTDLFELQKKALELTKGKNPVDEVQNLVMETLNKWGINNLPWHGDTEPAKTLWPKDTPEPSTGNNLNIDISENKTCVFVRALIPGIEDPNGLSVKLEGDLVVISGKSTSFTNDGGSFNRSVRLPAEVTATGAEASYRDESLTITLPKVKVDEGEIIPLNFYKE